MSVRDRRYHPHDEEDRLEVIFEIKVLRGPEGQALSEAQLDAIDHFVACLRTDLREESDRDVRERKTG